MINQYDKIALCSHVQQGKVRYFKEYALKGRVVGTECIPYSEFVRLLNQRGANKQSVKDACEIQPGRLSQAQTAQAHNKI